MASFVPTKPFSRWQTIIVALAIVSLAMSLATRALQLPTASHGTSVVSVSAQVKHQHLDSDAAKWVAPVPVVGAPPVAPFYSRVAPDAPSLPHSLFDEVLYNRPPPSC
jgi:hypothetical protein